MRPRHGLLSRLPRPPNVARDCPFFDLLRPGGDLFGQAHEATPRFGYGGLGGWHMPYHSPRAWVERWPGCLTAVSGRKIPFCPPARAISSRTPTRKGEATSLGCSRKEQAGRKIGAIYRWSQRIKRPDHLQAMLVPQRRKVCMLMVGMSSRNFGWGITCAWSAAMGPEPGRSRSGPMLRQMSSDICS